MSIRTKLLLVSLPLVLLIVIGMTGLAQRRVREIMEQEVAKRGLSVSSGAAQEPRMMAGCREGDEGQLLPILQAILESTQARYAFVLDPSGKVLAHSNVAQKGQVYRDPVTLEAIGSDRPGFRKRLYEGLSVMDISYPIRETASGESGEEFLLLGKEETRPGAFLGVLRVGLPLKDTLEAAARISRQVFWIIAGGSGLALALSLLFARRILRPIRLLAEAAQRLGRGNLGETVRVFSRDEIGELAGSFNRMSQDLAETTVSKDFLDSILKEMQEALIVTTPEGAIRMLNPPAVSLLGLPERDLVGKPVLPFFELGEAIGDIGALHDLIREGALRIAEGRCLSGSGATIPILLGASLFFTAEGRVGGYILTVRDITEQKRVEEERRQFDRQILQAERLASVGTVAAGIVHNLKNPLSGIVGFAELLQEQHPEIPYLKNIVTSGNQMEEMIESILAKSRQKGNVEPVNLNELLERELDFLQADLVFKHEVEKEIRLSDGLPDVKCVYTHLSQVFGNLLRNGVEAMHGRPAKRIKVTTDMEDGRIVVSITDSGCGIPEENLPSLFRPFFTTKTPSGDSKAPVGTGLGLYTAQQLLESYGGTIEVESEVGVGTTFRVQFPVMATAGASEQAA